MKSIILAITYAATLFFDSPDGHRRLEDQFTAKPSQRITLQGFSGTEIKVRSWEKSEVSVTLDVSFSSSRSRDEQRYLDAISLKKTETGDELRIALIEPEIASQRTNSLWSWLSGFFGGSYTRKEIVGEIFVPASNSLRAEVKYGSVSLDGMKGPLSLIGTGNTVILRNCATVQEVENDYGKTTIERSGGSLQLSAKSSTISVDQFTGKASIDADYSTITLRDITQSISVRSTSGTIKADRIGGNATIISDYSTITVNDASGMVDIEDQSGKVSVKNAAGVTVRGSYSSIEIVDISGKGAREIALTGQSATIAVTNATGNLKIENPYGNIDLRNIRGNVSLTSKSGRVTADEITGDWASDTEYSTYSVRGLSGKNVAVRNKSGKVDMTLKSMPTTVDIRNEYADVNLDLPIGFSGDVDLNVTYGRLDTNLPLQKSKSFDSSGGYGIRTVGGSGKAKISVETKSGNVRVMER